MFIGDFNISEYGIENSLRVKTLSILTNLHNLESLNHIKNSNNRTLDLCLTNFGKYNINTKKAPNIKVELNEGLVKPVDHHPPLIIDIELINTKIKDNIQTNKKKRRN